MKSQQIDYVKISREDFIKAGYYTCMIPADEKDIEIFKKIAVGQITHNLIKSDRKYSTHKYLWKIIPFAIDHGINDLSEFVVRDDHCMEVMRISKAILNARYIEHGSDYIEAWRSILKDLFLPKIEKTELDGTKRKVSHSMSYSNLDEINMKLFEDKAIRFYSDNLGISSEEYRENIYFGGK